MSDEERFRPGDRIHVAVGPRYYPATVVGSRLWWHPAGNYHRAYLVEFPGGARTECSVSSIMEFAEKRRHWKQLTA